MLLASACGGGGGGIIQPTARDETSALASRSVAETSAGAEAPSGSEPPEEVEKPAAETEDTPDSETPKKDADPLGNGPPSKPEAPAETEDPQGAEPPDEVEEPAAETEDTPGSETPKKDADPLGNGPPSKPEAPAKTEDPTGKEPPAEVDEPAAETEDTPDSETPKKDADPLGNGPPSKPEAPAETEDPQGAEPPDEVEEPAAETEDTPGSETPKKDADPLGNGPPSKPEAPAKTEDPTGKEPPAEVDEPAAETEDTPDSETPKKDADPLGNGPPSKPEAPAETEDPLEPKPPAEIDEPVAETENTPDIDTPEPKPSEVDPRVAEFAGVRIARLQPPVGDNGQIEFKPDDIVKVPGRLEMVDELERCLAESGSGCRSDANWLFQVDTEYNDHRKKVSLAIQSGAGDAARSYSPAIINPVVDGFSYQGDYRINLRIRDGSIPKGSWINFSKGSSFGTNRIQDPSARIRGLLDTPLMIANSVVFAFSAGNRGSDTPYTQATKLSHDYDPRSERMLDEAIRNTMAIFAYGLNNEGNDVHRSSSHCGAQVMTVCIGVPYELYHVTEQNRKRIGGGTSISAGLLSGTAWLMKSLWPDLTSKQIAAIMLATARPLHDGDAPANVRTGVGALDFTQLFEPVGPMTAKELGADDLVLERGFLHLPGLTDFDNPEGVDKFARSFQLVTSTLAIQPGFAGFDLDRFTPAAPGSRLHLAVRKQTGGAEDTALAFGHANKLVLSSRYAGLCRDGQNTDLCLTTTRREDFFGGQGSGSFRLEDTTYTSLAANHRLPIRDRLELGFGAALTEARTSGRHLVGVVAGRLLQAELSLRSDNDTRSRKTSTSISIWGSRFDGSMELLGRQSPLAERSAGVRLRWQLDF